MKRFLLPISLLMSGCSSLGGSHQHEPLIGSLQKQTPDSVTKIHSINHRKAAIRQYEAYLANNPDDKYAPEAMRRLADLTLENEQIADIQGKSSSDKTPSKAAELYQTLLDQYPDYKNSETVAYQLARAYEQQGDETITFKALTEYAQQYPEASNITEIQFRRGEHLFSMGEYEDAEQAYMAAVNKGDQSDFFLPSLYKAGWSQFKQNTIETSLSTFMRVLDNTIAEHNSANLPTNISKAEQGRLQDTLRAIGLGFSYLGNADAIDSYFTKNGHKTYEPLLYASLADLHFKKQRFTDAAETWRRFSTTHPDHPEAPLFQAHVIDVYTHAGFNDRALIEKQTFVNTYLPGSPYWEKYDIHQSVEIISKTENWLNDITIHYHAIADADKTPAAYATASEWYTTYLSGFPDSDKTPAINFLFAELLLDANQLQQAITEFERTAYEYSQHPKSAESGYAALLAYTELEKTFPAEQQKEQKTDWHRKGIDSAIRFSDNFPNHPQALTVRLRAAEQLFALKDFTATIKTAQTLVDMDTISPVIALPAWKISANAWYETSDFVQAEMAYNQVLALLPAEDTERTSIQTRLAASIYKQGEMARQSGDLPEAIKHFTRVTQVMPGSTIAATAGYDTAAAYITLQQIPQAIKTLEAWRQSYPNHKLNIDASRKLAVLYRNNKQPLLAATAYERLALQGTDPQQQREAGWMAASLFLEAGDTVAASRSFTAYVQQHPVPQEQAMEARAKLVDIYTSTANAQQLNYWQHQIIAAYDASTSKTDRGRYLAAHAQLTLAEPLLAAYSNVALVEPLQQNLLLKKKYLTQAIDAYSKAVNYHIADVSTESTYQTGHLYADFSDSLMKSQRPASLSAEELEQYDILLEEQAFPIEEQAIEIHESNVSNIADDHYDEWTRKSLTELARLLPARYKKIERSETYVNP
ncbi:MAG: tetratricopeptide repeat protein [Gammaproteobacteria bacterium]